MTKDFAFKPKEVVSDRRAANELAGYPNGIKPPPHSPELITSTNAKLRALKEEWAKDKK